jgi:hypothetical protein
MKTAIVTTTINVPDFFDGYCTDFLRYGHKDVCFVVIADKKTHAGAHEYCKKLQEKYGFEVEYFDVGRQQEYLRSYPELDAYLPYNSVQRRNIGMLYAYESGCDPIITVDDDNYLLEPDLLKQHLRVGTEATLRSVGSANGWFNPCKYLTVTPQLEIYHRGYPVARRFADAALSESRRTARIVVNVGMWLGDPDVDAWVRMTAPVEATQWNATENFTLASGTWAPFNSQQTGIAHDVLPAYFLNPNAGRYDDIWASYVLHRMANHLGHMISYGSPVVSHLQKRSLASLWRDIDDERLGTLLTEQFVAILSATTLRSSSYEGCYEELAEAITTEASRLSCGLDGRAFLIEYAKGMRMWLAVTARAAKNVRSGTKPALVESRK